MRISLHYNELSSINASDKWALSGEPYLRSHLLSLLEASGTAPVGLVFGRNATRIATILATRGVFGKPFRNPLTVAVVILHAQEHWRYDHVGKIPDVPPRKRNPVPNSIKFFSRDELLDLAKDRARVSKLPPSSISIGRRKPA